MKRTRPLILTLLLTSAVLASCNPSTGPADLGAAEIREYEGENLSSIDDFRENSIRGVQHISLDNYRLEITGLVEKPLSLTYDEVLDRDKYSKVVTLYCVEGWDTTILWEGVLIKDLINQAGAKEEAVTVVFHAEDGYTSALPLDFVRDNDIMLAYKMNDVILPPERGFPFQAIAESKWGYKWVKWVTKIELSDDTDYRGYWEERGYNNDGDIEGPIFER
ncbi:MAG: molybdopterin-dependent oxidoreductase [Anaerolineae bacterium]